MSIRLNQKDKIRILNSEDLFKIMRRILLRENKIRRNKEHFWVVGLASDNRILLIELISLGTMNATLVDAVEVFSLALQKRAAALIMVHNHPSGTLHPSKPDNNVTDRMIQVGDIVQVPILDHLIISENGYYSYAEAGMLRILKANSQYHLPFKEEELLRHEAKKRGIEIGREEGKKIGEKKVRAMAKEMKKKGFDLKIISEISGLSLADIKKL